MPVLCHFLSELADDALLDWSSPLAKDGKESCGGAASRPPNWWLDFVILFFGGELTSVPILANSHFALDRIAISSRERTQVAYYKKVRARNSPLTIVNFVRFRTLEVLPPTPLGRVPR